jgi:multicomponent Na+:H+ antiporter subunit B
VFLFLRGHNLPGGGFIGGLVAAAAILLQLVSQGPEKTQQLFPLDFQQLLALGLLLATAAGLPGLLSNKAFLTGIWISVPFLGSETIKVGTPLLFDLGVFLAVVGVTVEMILEVAEEEEWKGF